MSLSCKSDVASAKAKLVILLILRYPVLMGLARVHSNELKHPKMIPKRLAHIWIGPLAPPTEWMSTWQSQNPDWDYTLYDNEYLLSRRFRNHSLICTYFRQKEFAGVADLLRYEILFETGGFVAAADSICLRPIDDLLENATPFTCYEVPPELCGQIGMPRKKGLICPILGSPAGHPVLQEIIARIGTHTDPVDPPKPWKGTGNFFLRQTFSKRPDLAQQLHIYPAHFFVPEHFRGWIYDGPDKPYCRQMWGTTKSAYPSSHTVDQDDVKEEHERLLRKLEERL